MIQHEILANAKKCLGADQQIHHDTVVVIHFRQMIYTWRQNTDIPLLQQGGGALNGVRTASGELVHQLNKLMVVVIVGDKAFVPIWDDVAFLSKQCLRGELLGNVIDVIRQWRDGMILAVGAIILFPKVQLIFCVRVEQMDDVLLCHDDPCSSLPKIRAYNSSSKV